MDTFIVTINNASLYFALKMLDIINNHKFRIMNFIIPSNNYT